MRKHPLFCYIYPVTNTKNRMEKQVYTVTVTKVKTEWRNVQGYLHRLDGPAREWADGRKEWYQNGQIHRLDGPAREWSDGTKQWWQNGQIHRLDGPAVERVDGYKAWWINGQKLTEREFLAKTQPKELTLDEIAAKFGIPVEQLKIRKG